jgi:predicted MFS family arabinose efflux permease
MARKSKSSKKKWRCSLTSKGLCTAAEVGRVVTTYGSVLTIIGLVILLVLDITGGALGSMAGSTDVSKGSKVGAGVLLVLIALQCLVWWLVYKFDALAAGMVVVWGIALIMAVIGLITHVTTWQRDATRGGAPS